MTAVGSRYYTPNPFEVDANGVPLAGAQLFFYETETTTLQNTYQDVNLTTPNTNPVIADANGRFGNIWLIPSLGYKVQLFTAPTPDDPGGSEIWSADPVGPASGGTPSNNVGIVGEVRMFAGPEGSIPSQWYPCYGQAISRSTFASLFAVIGTLWGVGDGVNTFNVPDLRGRSVFGNDAMGGTPAGRVTSGVSGIAGNTIGASGGDQSTQNHTHVVTDPTHTHAISDPGHNHSLLVLNFTAPFSLQGCGNGITPGSVNTSTATTGITVDAASTGISIAAYGSGASQNMPPAAICEFIIYAGA